MEYLIKLFVCYSSGCSLIFITKFYKMSNVKIFVVEDDLSYALELEMLIEELGYELVASFKSAKGLFQAIKKEKPDLILMDIQLEGEMDGIEIAKRIQDEKIGIIFITSFKDKEIYNKTRQTRKFGYIVKPFNHLTLQSAIETALRLLDLQEKKNSPSFDLEKKQAWEDGLILKNYIFIKRKSKLEKVSLADIWYIEADGNYSLIKLENRKFILKLSLTKVSKILSDKKFIRISKGYIVNMEKISSIELSTNQLILGDLRLAIGRRYKELMLGKLKTLV